LIYTLRPTVLVSDCALLLAHCVAALSKSLIRVRFGDLDFKSDEDNEKIPFVERKIERKVMFVKLKCQGMYQYIE